MLAFRSIISLSNEGKVFFYFISNSDDFFQTDVCFGATKLILCEFFFFFYYSRVPYLFVLYDRELKKVLMMASSIHLSSNRS